MNFKFSTFFFSFLFISNIYAQNTNFVWAKQLGGPKADFTQGISVDVDNSGNVYTTGFFADTVDFDPGPNKFELKSTDHLADIYICKLDKDGNFVWAKSIGSFGDDYGIHVEIDPFGDIYA